MSNSDKLPIVQAVLSSWKFASVAWLPTAPVYLVRAMILGFFFSSMIVTSEAGGNFGLIGLLLIFFSEIACLTVTLRLAVRAEYNGFFGIQVSADEGRMAIAQLLYVALIWFVLLITGFVIFTLAGAYLSTTIPDITAIQDDDEAFRAAILSAFGSPVGIAVATVLALAFLFPVVFMAARLITFSAATIARKKVMIFETWAWTRGHALQVMIALVAALAPFVIMNQLGSFLISSAMGINLFGGSSEEELLAISKAQWFIFGFAAGILSAPINLVSSGLSAFMYEGFNPDGPR